MAIYDTYSSSLIDWKYTTSSTILNTVTNTATQIYEMERTDTGTTITYTYDPQLTDIWTISNDFYINIPHTKQDLERARLRNNLSIQIKSRANASLYPGESEPERKALETLREVITEEEFRKYLRYGFVLVKGKSGATYQVFRNQAHCKVWLNGRVIEEVCVRIKDEQVPKTDKVIAFKIIIEASEEEFKKLGNVYKMVA
jgi:hypothetical protein